MEKERWKRISKYCKMKDKEKIDELLEALKKCSSYLPYDKGLREEVKELILSASQNQQNEKESDAVEFADWLISTKWVKVINGIGYYTSKELYELFKQSKTNPPKEK
jgi:hypothetical protein